MKISVIGNGLIALILTKILITRGIYVDVYFSNNINNNFDTRTIGITEENLLFLENYYPSLRKFGNSINEIKIFKDKDINKEILKFNLKNKSQFYVFQYNKFFKIIKKNFNKSKYIKIKNISTINKNNFFKHKLIIDTDLKNKFSLKYFNKKIVKNYFSKAYTTIIDHKKVDNNIAFQIFTKLGPLAFLPINKKCTSIVFSIRGNSVEDFDVKQLIKNYNKKYIITKFSKIQKFDLKLSIQRKYNKLNVLAFGDKLHNIHPLAGQGMNMSLRDIRILIKIFDQNIDLGLGLDQNIFKKFEKQTKHKNFVFATGIDMIHEFFELEKKIPASISNKVFKLLNSSKFFIKLSSGLANKGL